MRRVLHGIWGRHLIMCKMILLGFSRYFGCLINHITYHFKHALVRKEESWYLKLKWLDFLKICTYYSGKFMKSLTIMKVSHVKSFFHLSFNYKGNSILSTFLEGLIMLRFWKLSDISILNIKSVGSKFVISFFRFLFVLQ